MASSRVLTRIDRYVLSQLTLALVLVTTGLVALIWLTQSLRFIQIIVNRGLSPVVFVKLTFLLVPSFVATILPITCFIVVLFVFMLLLVCDFVFAHDLVYCRSLLIGMRLWFVGLLLQLLLLLLQSFQLQLLLLQLLLLLLWEV